MLKFVSFTANRFCSVKGSPYGAIRITTQGDLDAESMCFCIYPSESVELRVGIEGRNRRYRTIDKDMFDTL